VNQEDIDKMVTGSPVLDERAAVEVAFRNYERYIAAPLKGVLDRDWKDEDLYAVAQIAANAITYRDREIKSLKERIAKMEQEAIERNNSHEHMRERLQWLQNEADSYTRASQKVKEAFGLEATSEQKAAPAKPAVSAAVVPAPEKWIVEISLLVSDSWVRSGNPGVSGVFSSKAEADKAISQQTDSILRRARRIE
jgi:FtsZ-binding cell division protein ZapB